jgi:hypothetical protein
LFFSFSYRKFLPLFTLSPSGGLAFLQIDVQALQIGNPQFLKHCVSRTAPFAKGLFHPPFPFPPTLFLLHVGFTLANPTISTFIGALGISLAPFPFLFQRLKAIFTVSSFPLSVDLGFT